MTAAKKKNSGRGRKVWYVSRFRERYELADNVRYDRKSPLLYTKDFVGSGSDDESCSYFRQMMALRSKLNWLSLRGAFAELKNVAGNMSNTFRGYLLNSRFEPASEKEIGRWLGVDQKQAEQIVTELEDVGLLERVDFPKFDTDDNKSGSKTKKRTGAKKKSKPRKKSQKKTTAKRPKAIADNSGGARAGPGALGGARKRTEEPGGARKPLKKKVKAKVKAKVKTNTKTKPLRVSEEKRRERKERISTAEQTKQQRQQRTEEPEKPEKPEKPENPTESEAGSAKRHFLPKPARSVNRRIGPQRIGDVINDWLPDHWQDPEAELFGWEIVRALGYPTDKNNLKIRSEWGAFASWWCKVKKAAPAMVLDELRAKAIGKADYLRTKGKSAKNRSAVWFHIMNGELNQRGVIMTQMPCASPLRRESKRGSGRSEARWKVV